MKISICIACVDKHIVLLEKFMDSIIYFTRKPDEVIVSLSPKFLKLDLLNEKIRLENKYNNLKCLVQETMTNAAINRNKCIEESDGDIIIIHDADDVMHPQKCEIIEKLFIEYPDTKMILHRFKIMKERNYLLNNYKKINIEKKNLYFIFKSNNNIGEYPPIYITNYDYNSIKPEQPYASGYITIKKDVFKRIKYENRNKGEDSCYITNIHNIYNKTLFIDEVMAEYTPSLSYK